MMSKTVGISTNMPTIPDDAEFAIYIEFAKDQPNPQRIFQAVDLMIQSMQSLDKVLCSVVDTQITPVLLLEDIQQGSLKIWLKTALEKVPDDAIKNLNWRSIIGQYLVQAKYAYIKWKETDIDGKKDINQISNELQQLAENTDLLEIPAYNKPNLEDLEVISRNIQEAKSYLSQHDQVSYLLKDGSKVEFNLCQEINFEKIIEANTANIIENNAEVLLIVKKPDYLEHSKWQFRQGKKSINAKIDDMEWLKQFHDRKIDIRPGDSIKCNLLIISRYDSNSELIKEEYSIQKVLQVIELPIQLKLIED